MFDQEMLAHIWFVILWTVFASYLVLDGFDFGVGVSVSLTCKTSGAPYLDITICFIV